MCVCVCVCGVVFNLINCKSRLVYMRKAQKYFCYLVTCMRGRLFLLLQCTFTFITVYLCYIHTHNNNSAFIIFGVGVCVIFLQLQ